MTGVQSASGTESADRQRRWSVGIEKPAQNVKSWKRANRLDRVRAEVDHPELEYDVSLQGNGGGRETQNTAANMTA